MNNLKKIIKNNFLLNIFNIYNNVNFKNNKVKKISIIY